MNQTFDYKYSCDNCFSDKKYEKLNGTVLKCSCPGFVSFANATEAGTTQTLAALQINTSEFEHPCIQLSFNANIFTGVTGGYNFQIFKLCSNQLTPIPVSGIYEYARVVATTESDSFNFTVCDCDCDSCMDGCCTYYALVTVTIPTVLDAYIGNIILSAIVTENDCNC